jgi:hypothetical protein
METHCNVNPGEAWLPPFIWAAAAHCPACACNPPYVLLQKGKAKCVKVVGL